MKSASDIQAMILNAVIAGTRTKIIFRMADPDDAAYLQRVLFLGFVDYAEYKAGTERPIAVGHEKVIALGTSESEQYAEHEMEADTHMSGRAHAQGTMTVDGSGSGSGIATGESAGQVLSPPMMLSGPGAVAPQTILSESRGSSESRNEFEVSNRSHGTSDIVVESEGEAHTVAHGTSHGRSHTQSATETYISKYEWMKSETFTAAEQAERLTGEIMNLALRECFVKIDNQRPVRTRTADLPPAFRSDYFRRVAMPIYRTTALARSPYVFPAAEVDAQIAQRKVLPPAPPPPEPNFSPEPFPFLDSPHEFARDFIAKKRSDPAPKPTPRSKTKKPPTKKYPPFTVIPGGLDGDNDRDG